MTEDELQAVISSTTLGVTGPLTNTQLRATPVAVTGDLTVSSVAVSNFPSPQVVSGSVSVSNLPVTQPVSGSVSVSNLPVTQPVSGSVSVSNLPATQPVSAVALPLPSNASTEATLSGIKTGTDRIPAQGQALAAASTPVVLTALQVSALTPPAALTNFANETGGNLATIAGKDFATQTTLASIKTKTDNIPAQGQALASASTPVVLTAVQVSALTPPAAITGFALEAGHLAAIDTSTAKIPAQGQALAGSSLPVVLPAAQITTLTPIAGNLEATQLLVKAKTDNIPALGQALAASSVPVVLTAAQLTTLTPIAGLTDAQLRASAVPVSGPATDAQMRASAIPVSGTVSANATLTAETTKVIGTVNQGGTWTVQPGNTANATAWKVDGSGVTQPVSGTVSANASQTGTWTVQPGNTANTTAWKVDGSAVTQPVSLASVPSHAVTNSGTFAVQAASTLAAETTKVIGTVNVAAAQTIATTNAGTFAVQAAATLAAETTKVIGTVNVAAAQTIAVTNAGTFAVQGPTLTKGTQGANGFSVQDLKDSGRVALSFYAVAAASGATGVETAITLTKSSGTGATANAVSFVVTNGKRFRITAFSVATRGHATATIQTTTFNLRVNTAGAVIVSTTPIVLSARSATPATASAWDRYPIPIPDGYEILGDGTLQFGITANSTFVTNAPTWDVTILGYEY